MRGREARGSGPQINYRPTPPWAPAARADHRIGPQGQEDRAPRTQAGEAVPRFWLPIEGAKRGTIGMGLPPHDTRQSDPAAARPADPVKARAHHAPNQARPKTPGKPSAVFPHRSRLGTEGGRLLQRRNKMIRSPAEQSLMVWQPSCWLAKPRPHSKDRL
ncbi:hypothetical protein NDU88_004266 [Pleurodeles waltl]|uniref:Uncharacterized protein n=1 Tax=Pleurodeles waltl TaxID=8319 RepID=A0AAV7W8J9_PLEWA|nr:hypothetical protein NDU88_004266 [Pleurodeles waltl]